MLLSFLTVSILSHYPTVLVHGIGGNAEDLIDLDNTLTNKGIDTYSLQIGNGKIDSIFWNMNKQCASLNSSIANLNLTEERINILGISQGGLLARCYVERYAHLNKRVNSLITYGTPHMGIYTPWFNLNALEYWKDPFAYNKYLETNDFLVFINNEKDHDGMQLYKSNLLSINHFLIVWSEIDKVISPIASSRFEFYNISLAREKNSLEIVPLNQTEEYLQDTLGLRSLTKANKLSILNCPCKHEEFKHPKCFSQRFPGQSLTLIDFTIDLL
jgi:cephalosporin-C deacetylase-like acetyl esterase